MTCYLSVLEGIMAYNNASSFIAVDCAIYKAAIFDKQKLIGTPVGVVGPRSVSVISLSPRIVVNLQRLTPKSLDGIDNGCRPSKKRRRR